MSLLHLAAAGTVAAILAAGAGVPVVNTSLRVGSSSAPVPIENVSFARAEAPRLGAVTTISGSRTAMMKVRLPRAATLRGPDHRNPGVEVVRGQGKITGLMMLRGHTGSEGTAFVMGEAKAPTRVTDIGIGLSEDLEPKARRWRLPRGIYRLYLITDGKPATVRLSLDGPRGHKTLWPRDRVPFELKAPKLQRLSDNVVIGGAEHKLRTKGLVYGVWLTDHEVLAANSVENCLYYGGAPETGAYTPGCAFEGDGYRFNFVSVFFSGLDRVGTGMEVATFPVSGRFAIGFNEESAGVPSKGTNFAAFWMGFK